MPGATGRAERSMGRISPHARWGVKPFGGRGSARGPRSPIARSGRERSGRVGREPVREVDGGQVGRLGPRQGAAGRPPDGGVLSGGGASTGGDVAADGGVSTEATRRARGP